MYSECTINYAKELWEQEKKIFFFNAVCIVHAVNNLS